MSTFVDFFFPRRCLICNRVLASGEKDLCLNCLYIKPYIGDSYHKYKQHITSKPFEQIDVFLSYEYCKLALWDFKYRGNVHKGRWLGRMWADHLKDFEWISEIDYIIPTPLHWKKLRTRGFNQSEVLGRVLSKKLNIPIRTRDLKRRLNNKPQVHSDDRWENVKNVFKLRSLKRSECLNGKTLLIIDDVITSSATINELLEALEPVNAKIYLAFLASH